MSKVYGLRYVKGTYNGKDLAGKMSVGVSEYFPPAPKDTIVERSFFLDPDEAEALAVDLINQAFICRAEADGKFGAGSPDSLQLAFPEYWKVRNQYEHWQRQIEPVFKRED